MNTLVKSARIAVLDDEAEVATIVSRALAEHGYTTATYASAGTFLDSLASVTPDLIILDLGLPDMDGISLLLQLRKVTERIPVIILSGRADDADRIVGLELGADDYLGKPFNPRELVARVRSVLRRSQPDIVVESVEQAAHFYGFIYAPQLHSLTAPDGTESMLGTTEARLLEAFLEAPNRILTRDHLLQRAAREDALDRAVDVSVSRLRKRLMPLGESHNPIRTVYGAGYLFTASVEWK